MRSLALSFTVLAGLAGAPVIAQTYAPATPQGVPPGTDPATGARPGNEVGTGMLRGQSNRSPGTRRGLPERVSISRRAG